MNQAQLGRVTRNHVTAFFEGDENFLGIELSPELQGSSTFTCENGTTLKFTGTVAFMEGSTIDSNIMNDLLDYLFRTRNSFASFLRELGWADLDKVKVLLGNGDEFNPATKGGKPAEETSESKKLLSFLPEGTAFFIIVIAVPCLFFFILALVITTCRRRGCCGGGSLSREEVEAAQNKEHDNTEMQDTTIRNQVETSSSSSSSGADSDEDVSIPLGYDPKTTACGLLRSTITVGTEDVSSVSLSRILDSESSLQGSVQTEGKNTGASDSEKSRSTSPTDTSQKQECSAGSLGGSTTGSELCYNGSSVTSPTSNAVASKGKNMIHALDLDHIPEVVERRIRDRSPMSDCRGFLKRNPSIGIRKQKHQPKR